MDNGNSLICSRRCLVARYRQLKKYQNRQPMSTDLAQSNIVYKWVDNLIPVCKFYTRVIDGTLHNRGCITSKVAICPFKARQIVSIVHSSDLDSRYVFTYFYSCKSRSTAKFNNFVYFGVKVKINNKNKIFFYFSKPFLTVDFCDC